LFNEIAAHEAAELAALRKSQGRPVDMRDTFIAGIALSQRTVSLLGIRDILTIFQYQ